jgi:hypothetical protein
VVGFFTLGDVEWVGIGLGVADCAVAAVGVALMVATGLERPRLLYASLPPGARLMLCLLLLCAVFVFGVYGYGYDANQFIYNRF